MPVKPLPPSFISKADANARVKDYQKLSSPIGNPDTKSIFYKKDHIVSILAEMEAANATGLRLYFGRYPSLISDPNDPPEAINQLMVVFVMTQQELATGIERDIFLDDMDNFTERLEATKTLGASFDHGSPCPPDCSLGSVLPLP